MRIKERKLTGTTSNEPAQWEAEHRRTARKAAAEGFVLLKNEGGILPLARGSRIGLYGAGADKTIKGGTGSGDVNERDCVSIFQGLTAGGYEIVSREWIQAYDRVYEQERCRWRDDILSRLSPGKENFFEVYSTTPFLMPCGPGIDMEKAMQDGADTAIYVLSRIAGENADRRDEPGDYYITAEERSLLGQISEAYRSVVLVVNTGGLVDLGFVDELPNIDAVIQFVQAGQEGGNAFADILSGDVSPSGKLADTWTYQYTDYPNAQTFSYKNGDVNTEKYKEGIYVGYRYFDTFEVPVRYGFGYGLSYTDFELCTSGISSVEMKGGLSVRPAGRAEGRRNTTTGIRLNVSVTNTGDTYAGKEVVQVYVSCPQKRLTKEFRRLAAFGKTRLLAPKETQELKLLFPLYDLASYSEEDAAWILEQGTYGIWVGNSLASSSLAGTICLDEEVVMVQCEHICPLQEELEEIVPDLERVRQKEEEWQKEADRLSFPPVMIYAKDIPTQKIIYTDMSESLTGPAGEITESLETEQLIRLATGDPGRGQGSSLGSAGFSVPGSAAETSSAASASPWNVAGMVLADGPAGLRLNQTYQIADGEIVKESFLKSLEKGFFASEAEKTGTTYYQYCTAVPVGTLLAQTWNTELIEEIGEMTGSEMERFGITLWLAPGMNIHRNPLCGRNFEYYSEDPLLSGLMASAMTLGVQKLPGVGTTIKHFACNNQEDNRMGSDSVVSERALREIYLKGFETAVKNSQPMSIMTSYNMINGVHAANCYDICKKAARDEWGFCGAVMTDWTTTTDSTRGICTASGCMRAGNDMVMPGTFEDHEEIRRALDEGRLTLRELKWCVCNTIRLCIQSNQYEDAVSYLEQFQDAK